MENKTKIILGLMGVFLVLASSGATYMLEPTGESSRCYAGWDFVEDGSFEGQFACQTSSDLRHEYCSSVYDSKSGRTDFYCDLAVPVLIENEQVERDNYKCNLEGCEI